MPYDPKERWNDIEEAKRSTDEASQSDMWTAVPVIFKKHDTDTNTVHAQPTIKLKHVKADGSAEWVQFPELHDVPLHYPGGGGATWTFPIKDGDEGLLVVSSRSIDKWWNEGGVQQQDTFRMHHISDGMAIPGFRSQPRKLKNVHATNAQLRSEDGEVYFEFDPDNKRFKIVSPTVPVEITGDLHVSGEIIRGFGTGDQVTLGQHTHAQDDDSHGDTEQETHKPTAGT